MTHTENGGVHYTSPTCPVPPFCFAPAFDEEIIKKCNRTPKILRICKLPFTTGLTSFIELVLTGVLCVLIATVDIHIS